MSMQIFIPSSGRAHKQTTLASLPASILYRTTIVVPKNEWEEYAAKLPIPLFPTLEAPDIPPGIGHARQWCCDQATDKVLMLDDDLVFATRRDDDPTKFRDSTEGEIAVLFGVIENELTLHASVGVSTREGGNRDTNIYAYNTRLLRILAYRTDILRKEDIRFDQIPVMEDFYVALSLLTKGYENLKINWIVHNQGGSNTDGGCSQYRTPEVQAAAAHALHAKFPEFVKVVEKETKTAWGGGIRTDVQVQWKKALASAGGLKMSNKDKLLYWISVRWKILAKKEAGLPAPWSADPVFQTTYFCNVRREDDKVTKWIREKYVCAGMVGRADLNMIIARFVNKPESLEAMGWPFCQWGLIDVDNFIRVMSKKGAWGGAYIVSTNGRRMPKHNYITELLTKAHAQLYSVALGPTLAAAHKQLMQLQGLGSFMAAQIVADLKNTPGHILADAPDWWTWSAHGPGSLRGLGWINDCKITPAMYPTRMMMLRQDIEGDWPEGVPRICNQDLQNCLCEFDKYMRVSTGSGKSKRKYNGTD